MTKQGFQQFEEILESRIENAYRNKKVPLVEPLAQEKYIGAYDPKTRRNPEWTDIIKPTLDKKDEITEKLHVLTPSI